MYRLQRIEDALHYRASRALLPENISFDKIFIIVAKLNNVQFDGKTFIAGISLREFNIKHNRDIIDPERWHMIIDLVTPSFNLQVSGRTLRITVKELVSAAARLYHYNSGEGSMLLALTAGYSNPTALML